MTDQNRKTLRSFYCLDALWSSFEQQTHEFGVSMDYLINESMRQYAETQGFGITPGYTSQPQVIPTQSSPSVQTARPGRATTGFTRSPAPLPSGQPPMGQRPLANNGMNGMQPGYATAGAPSQPPVGQHVPPMNTGPIPQHIPTMGPNQMGPPHAQVNANPPGQSGFSNHNFGSYDAPPQPPRGESYPSMQATAAGWSSGPRPNAAPGPGGAPGNFAPHMQAPPQPPRPQHMIPPGGAPILYLYFDNNRYTIGTDDFVIGRGSQRTDLTIRDGNISRRHCAILHRNGSHYIKDLGSTNGVEFQGNRIESKKISEGDVYYLCDYELRFSYQ